MYNKGIENGLKKGLRNEVIARKIYLSFPTHVFIGQEEIEFEIKSSICSQFKLPISSIQFAGSAKPGFSYFKNRKFVPGESDLDVAIIDQGMFIKYNEIVLRETKGFKDFSSFERNENGSSNYNSYQQYITKGIFRPDLMPKCTAKNEWFIFFNKLSGKYFELFKDINAGIYLSEKFFEFKQADNINNYTASL